MSASSPPPIPRAVTVNGKKLSDKEIADAARNGVQLTDGDFWYDRILGAWGCAGSATRGLIQPGLDIGGPLASDASNGKTGYFINGRQLPLMELTLLFSVTGLFSPGRYWLDNAGNYGFEGGPIAGNLWMTPQSAAAPRQGILSSYDKTGIAVFSG